jgi:hypothetical protein
MPYSPGSYAANQRAAAIVHRTALATPDVLPAVGALTPTGQTAGSLVSATNYYAAVVASNKYGSAVSSPILGPANPGGAGANHAVRLAFAAPAGMLSTDTYDVFFDTVTPPQWVGRITEAQRASGIVINGTGTTTAGGAAGSVDVWVTSPQGALQNAAAVAFSSSNAFLLGGITPLGCASYSLAHLMVKMTVTDLRSAATAVLTPFLQTNAGASDWYATQPLALTALGGAGLPFYQDFYLNVDGATNLLVAVAQLTGQGTAVTITVELA